MEQGVSPTAINQQPLLEYGAARSLEQEFVKLPVPLLSIIFSKAVTGVVKAMVFIDVVLNPSKMSYLKWGRDVIPCGTKL